MDIQNEAREAFRTIVDEAGLALIPANVGYSFLGHSRESIDRMYRLKGRTYDNPCIVAANRETLTAVTQPIPAHLLDWVEEVASWSPFAVIWRVDQDAAPVRALDWWVRAQSTVDDTVAVFLNTGSFVEHMVELAQDAGVLLVGSSGNLSGTGNNFRFEDVPAYIRSNVDYSIDIGPSEFENPAKQATTIVDLTNFTVRREGVNAAEIIASFKRMAADHDDLPSELAVRIDPWRRTAATRRVAAHGPAGTPISEDEGR